MKTKRINPKRLARIIFILVDLVVISLVISFLNNGIEYDFFTNFLLRSALLFSSLGAILLIIGLFIRLRDE